MQGWAFPAKQQPDPQKDRKRTGGAGALGPDNQPARNLAAARRGLGWCRHGEGEAMCHHMPRMADVSGLL